VWVDSRGSALEAMAAIGSLVLVLGYVFGEVGGKETVAGLITMWGLGTALPRPLRSARGQ